MRQSNYRVDNGGGWNYRLRPKAWA
jgi:hypothetical protein